MKKATKNFSEYSFGKQKVLQIFLTNMCSGLLLRDKYSHINSWDELEPLLIENQSYRQPVPSLIFVDAHGGLGLWKRPAQGYNPEKRCLGSSIMAFRHFERNIKIPFLGMVFEKNSKTYENLVSKFEFVTSPVYHWNCDNRHFNNKLHDVLDEYNMTPDQEDAPDGVVYYDNTGAPKVSELLHLTSGNSYDMLIHSSATGVKRSKYRQGRINPDFDVLTNLTNMDRRYWYISNPVDLPSNNFHFYFLHGTNSFVNSLLPGGWTDNYRYPGLHPIDSLEGKKAQARITYSNREFDDLSLWDDNIVRTFIPDRLTTDVNAELISAEPNTIREAESLVNVLNVPESESASA
jgi:hypothetical protein